MKGPDATIRLTVGQAVVRFLVAQHTERDGTTQRAILGISGIVGHGNVLGLAQGVEEDGDLLQRRRGAHGPRPGAPAERQLLGPRRPDGVPRARGGEAGGRPRRALGPPKALRVSRP